MPETRREYDSELKCHGCGIGMSEDQEMYDTGWLGIHWCGKPECAVKIMESCTDLMEAEEGIHYEEVCVGCGLEKKYCDCDEVEEEDERDDG